MHGSLGSSQTLSSPRSSLPAALKKNPADAAAAAAFLVYCHSHGCPHPSCCLVMPPPPPPAAVVSHRQCCRFRGHEAAASEPAIAARPERRHREGRRRRTHRSHQHPLCPLPSPSRWLSSVRTRAWLRSCTPPRRSPPPLLRFLVGRALWRCPPALIAAPAATPRGVSPSGESAPACGRPAQPTTSSPRDYRWS